MTSPGTPELGNGTSSTSVDRIRRRVPGPQIGQPWRLGFPLLLIVAAVWSLFLIQEGFDEVLDSQEGATLEVVVDPDAPGFEAFVEQTWSLLIASEDTDGRLVGVTIFAVVDRHNGGGTVLILPPESKFAGRTLAENHEMTGIEGLRSAVVGLLDVEFSDTALLTPPRLLSLVEPAGTLTVLPSAEIISSSDAVDYLSRSLDNPMDRALRQESWWRAWFGKVASTLNPSDHLPEIAIELVDAAAAISKGDVRVVAWPSVAPAADWIQNTVIETFPFPIPVTPGSRTTVRLLNGHGSFDLDDLARELLVAAGAEVSVIGNFEEFDVIGTRVVYRDPALVNEAARLAVVVGGGTLHDPLLSPVADLTIVMGADFVADYAGTISDAD